MNDPLLGLHVAAEIDLREIGLLFYLAAASATVSEALEYLSRYAATSNDEIRLEISHHKDEAVLTFQPVVALDVPRGQFSELHRAVVQQGAAQPDEPGLCPIAHELCARPECRGSRRSTVSCDARSSSRRRQIAGYCRKASWNCRSSPRTAASWVSWRRMVTIYLSEKQAMGGLQGMVENQLVSALAGGKVQAAEIANQLGMSVRSLRRQLAEEGTSFGEILDRVRQRLAHRYLEDERISTSADCLAPWLFGNRGVQPRLQTVDRHFAPPRKTILILAGTRNSGSDDIKGHTSRHGRMACVEPRCTAGRRGSAGSGEYRHCRRAPFHRRGPAFLAALSRRAARRALLRCVLAVHSPEARCRSEAMQAMQRDRRRAVQPHRFDAGPDPDRGVPGHALMAQAPEPMRRGRTEPSVIGIAPGRQIWPPCVCPPRADQTRPKPPRDTPRACATAG